MSVIHVRVSIPKLHPTRLPTLSGKENHLVVADGQGNRVTLVLTH